MPFIFHKLRLFNFVSKKKLLDKRIRYLNDKKIVYYLSKRIRFPFALFDDLQKNQFQILRFSCWKVSGGLLRHQMMFSDPKKSIAENNFRSHHELSVTV
jgi:hypothetical protein